MLRVVDANLNRIGEGLRLLEDIARFNLNDKTLSLKLKKLRHYLIPSNVDFQKKLLSARQAGEDVAAFNHVNGETLRTGTISVVQANAKRVQQSLRVIEEYSKISPLNKYLDTGVIKERRFELYEIEKQLVLRLARRDNLNKISGLCFALDVSSATANLNAVKMVENVIQAGVKLIALNDNVDDCKKLLGLARNINQTCQKAGATFIIKGNVVVALAVETQGILLGSRDCPVEEAREILPVDMIIGRSVSTYKEAVAARISGADFLHYPGRDNWHPVNLKTLQRIKRSTGIPVIVSVKPDSTHVSEIIQNGADSLCIANEKNDEEKMLLSIRNMLADINRILNKSNQVAYPDILGGKLLKNED